MGFSLLYVYLCINKSFKIESLHFRTEEELLFLIKCPWSCSVKGVLVISEVQ